MKWSEDVDCTWKGRDVVNGRGFGRVPMLGGGVDDHDGESGEAY